MEKLVILHDTYIRKGKVAPCTGVRPAFFVSDTFLIGPKSIQPANGPTIFIFFSHAAARLPHAGSRLPEDDVAARRPEQSPRRR
jgi:hypothetical protein